MVKGGKVVPVEEAEAQQAAASKAEGRDRHESHGRSRSSHGSSRHHERSSRGEGRGRGSSHAAGSDGPNSSNRSGNSSRNEDRAAKASNAAAAAQADKAAAPRSTEEAGAEEGTKTAAAKVSCITCICTHAVRKIYQLFTVLGAACCKQLQPAHAAGGVQVCSSVRTATCRTAALAAAAVVVQL